MILDIFQQIFQTFQAFFITIPLDNTLGTAYVVLNAIALFFISLLGGGGGGIDFPF